MVPATTAGISMTEGTGLAATAGEGAASAVPATAGAGAAFAVAATAGAGIAFAVAAPAVVAGAAVGAAVAAVAVAAAPALPISLILIVLGLAGFIGGVPYGMYRTVKGYHIVINSTDAVLDLAITEVGKWQGSTTHKDNSTEAVSKEKKLESLGKHENLTRS